MIAMLPLNINIVFDKYHKHRGRRRDGTPGCQYAEESPSAIWLSLVPYVVHARWTLFPPASQSPQSVPTSISDSDRGKEEELKSQDREVGQVPGAVDAGLQSRKVPSEGPWPLIGRTPRDRASKPTATLEDWIMDIGEHSVLKIRTEKQRNYSCTTVLRMEVEISVFNGLTEQLSRKLTETWAYEVSLDKNPCIKRGWQLLPANSRLQRIALIIPLTARTLAPFPR
ncbi:uncharacterized protein BDV17DRAFT_15179 [Aspergillus undulatus]|uniref:uncharacterized protein n=1 Tax=Aspergillus undulatus TaxID=1810928 RepID=UPI003CCD9C44